MEKLSQGKRAFVTGGGSGIGRACALALAVEGCFVTVAGRTEDTLPTDEWTSEMLDEMLASNVRGTFLPIKHELEFKRRQGFGAIVNIGSDAGLLGVPGHSGYLAPKHAGIGLTRSAALEYAAQGIRVNAVTPGLVDTPLIHDASGELYDYIKPLIAAHPIGRIAHPQEIADAVVWLASEKASYATGVALLIDGGYSAA